MTYSIDRARANGWREAQIMAAEKADFYAKTGDGLKWNTPEEAAAASKAAKHVAREIADAIRAMKRSVE